MSAPYYTTFRVADLLDDLCDAYDAARARVADAHTPAWDAALRRAWDYLLTAETISYHAPTHTLRVPSAQGGRAYDANGACQCEAYRRGRGACWHRAAARLVRRALERRLERALAEVDALFD